MLYLSGQMLVEQGSKIAGWNVGATELSSGTGSNHIALKSSGDYAIQAGQITTTDAEGNEITYPAFSVTHSGNVFAANGTFAGNIIANSLTLGSGVKVGYDSVDNAPEVNMIIFKDGTIGQLTAEVGTTETAGGFKVSSEGLLQATNAVISGTIYAKDGHFTGKVTATELELGSGVLIDYNKLENTPDIPVIPDLTVYIEKGTIVAADGIEKVKEGVDAFYVSKTGLLQASNAIIYGTIYASNGTFAGELKAAKGSFEGEVTATKGTFSNVTIKSNCTIEGTFSAKKITSDTFDPARIPNISADKITTGILTMERDVNNVATIEVIYNPGEGKGNGYSTRVYPGMVYVGDACLDMSGLRGNLGGYYMISNTEGSLDLYSAGQWRIAVGGVTAKTPSQGSLYATVSNNVTFDSISGAVYAAKNGSSSAIKTNQGDYTSKNLKENIVKFTEDKYTNALELLDNIDLYTYDYKYGLYADKPQQYGFLIDEIMEQENYKDFFDFYKEPMEIRDGRFNANIDNAKPEDIIDVYRYDDDVLDKYLLTCIKGLRNQITVLQQEIEELKKEKTL